MGSHQAAAQLQGTRDLMSSFGNALSFPAKLFAVSGTNYQMFLKPPSVGNKVLCYTNKVAWQNSAGVCSTLGQKGGCCAYLLMGKERSRHHSYPGERCCFLPCQGTQWCAPALEPHKTPQCRVQGKGTEISLPRTCVTTCLRQTGNPDGDRRDQFSRDRIPGEGER